MITSSSSTIRISAVVVTKACFSYSSGRKQAQYNEPAQGIMPHGPTRRIRRGHSGKLRCVAAPESSRIKDLAAASDAVAEKIHAGYYVVTGTAFKVLLLAVFGPDGIGPCADE